MVLSENSLNTAEENFVHVTVRNPITHNTWEDGKYTSYEIYIETNNNAFTLFNSSVRRRYSEFIWLKRLLEEQNGPKNMPLLPGKRFFNIFESRFDVDFIKHRMNGLEHFLNKAVMVTEFMSNVATHLFLQSSASIKEMEQIISGDLKIDVYQVIKTTGICKETYSRSVMLPNRSICSSAASSDQENDSHSDSDMLQQTRLNIKFTAAVSSPARLYRQNSPHSDTDSDSDSLSSHDHDRTLPRLLTGSNSLEYKHGSFCDGDIQSDCKCRGFCKQTEVPEHTLSKSERRVTFSNEVTIAEVIDRSNGFI